MGSWINDRLRIYMCVCVFVYSHSINPKQNDKQIIIEIAAFIFNNYQRSRYSFFFGTNAFIIRMGCRGVGLYEVVVWMVDGRWCWFSIACLSIYIYMCICVLNSFCYNSANVLYLFGLVGFSFFFLKCSILRCLLPIQKKKQQQQQQFILY